MRPDRTPPLLLPIGITASMAGYDDVRTMSRVYTRKTAPTKLPKRRAASSKSALSGGNQQRTAGWVGGKEKTRRGRNASCCTSINHVKMGVTVGMHAGCRYPAHASHRHPTVGLKFVSHYLHVLLLLSIFQSLRMLDLFFAQLIQLFCEIFISPPPACWLRAVNSIQFHRTFLGG